MAIATTSTASTTTSSTFTVGQMLSNGSIITAIASPNTYAYTNMYTPTISGYYPSTVVYGPTSNYYATNLPQIYERNLSESLKLISMCGKEIIKNKLFNLLSEPITYDRVSNTYIVLIENDLQDEIANFTQIKDFFKTRRGLMVIAYDMLLNRLEFSSICKEDEPISNIDMLLDHKLQIKIDKTEYFASLKSRFMPIVNYKLSSIEGSDNIVLERNIKAGLLPVVHTPNYVYNLQTSKKEPTQKASKLLDSLLCEGYLINKEGLPEIQQYFSPEYAYLSFKNKEEITKALKVFDKSKQGLINLLQNITVPGTSVTSFVEAVISQCALNQSVINIEEYAYITIRNLIETNIC